MESRRCRKVIALLMATVIILGSSVQNVSAATIFPNSNLYRKVAVWQECLQECLKDEINSFRLIIHTKIREIPLLKNAIGVKDFESNEVAFVVQKVTNNPEQIASQEQVEKQKQIENIEKADKQEQAENQKQDANPEQIANQRQTAKARNRVPTDEKTGNFSRSGVDIMSEDLELLARIIYAEARGECFEGQVAVGAVVLNRVESPHFPGTVKEVIYQAGQFTAVRDGQFELKPDSVAYQAALAALEGADPTNGALFYYNPKLATDSWIRTRSVVRSIGNHRFCV